MFPHSEQKIQFTCNFGKSLVKNKKQHTHIYKTILTVVQVQNDRSPV